MLDDEPRLVDFVEGMARRNGGRVFSRGPTGSVNMSSTTICASARADAASFEA